MSRFIIACGGTGGHLTPGISLAQSLNAQGHSCWLVISRKAVDSRLISRYPNLNFVRAPGIGTPSKTKDYPRFLRSQWQSIVFNFALFQNVRPDFVIGFGGFTSFGTLLVSMLRRVPFALHEANLRVGRTFRLFHLFAKRIYLQEGTFFYQSINPCVRHYGYPVRNDIHPIDPQTARRRLGIETQGKLVLILGGSQGARPLTQWARQAFKGLAQKEINLYCICGTDKNKDILEYKSPSGRIIKAYFKTFSDQMGELLSAADLVVSRAGAGTIAEITRCKVPTIFIPFPQASDDHQWHNAQFMEEQGAGLLIDQSQLDTLEREVSTLLERPELIQFFQKNLERLDKKNTLTRMIDDLNALTSKPNKKVPPLTEDIVLP